MAAGVTGKLWKIAAPDNVLTPGEHGAAMLEEGVKRVTAQTHRRDRRDAPWP